MKNKIDTSNWKRFNLYNDNLFLIDTGNKFRRDIAMKLNILLPVNNEEKIDFNYMEDYMKSIELKAQEKIKEFKRI